MANAKDVVERGWRAYIARDLDALAAAYAEDAVLTVPGAPPAEGREAIRQLWSTFLDAFPHDSPTIMRIRPRATSSPSSSPRRGRTPGRSRCRPATRSPPPAATSS